MYRVQLSKTQHLLIRADLGETVIDLEYVGQPGIFSATGGGAATTPPANTHNGSNMPRTSPNIDVALDV